MTTSKLWRFFRPGLPAIVSEPPYSPHTHIVFDYTRGSKLMQKYEEIIKPPLCFKKGTVSILDLFSNR